MISGCFRELFIQHPHDRWMFRAGAGSRGPDAPVAGRVQAASRRRHRFNGSSTLVQKIFFHRAHFRLDVSSSSMRRRRTVRTSRSASPRWPMPRMRADVSTTRPSSDSHHPRCRPSISTTWVLSSSSLRLAMALASRLAYLPRGKSRALNARVSPAELRNVHRWPAGRTARTFRNDGCSGESDSGTMPSCRARASACPA